MQQLNNVDYYVARAATSRHRAEAAADPEIAAIHAEFATRYDRLAVEADAQHAPSEFRVIQLDESGGEDSSHRTRRCEPVSQDQGWSRSPASAPSFRTSATP